MEYIEPLFRPFTYILKKYIKLWSIGITLFFGYNGFVMMKMPEVPTGTKIFGMLMVMTAVVKFVPFLSYFNYGGLFQAILAIPPLIFGIIFINNYLQYTQFDPRISMVAKATAYGALIQSFVRLYKKIQRVRAGKKVKVESLIPHLPHTESETVEAGEEDDEEDED